ncbi:MAG TPA: hypothetical protein VMC83_06475 [Streptosporangiaceae bacterium]|nr:hypothetical protein [Streptosporangiaceae bacterium]
MTRRSEQKSFQQPDETRSFENGDMRLLKIGGADIGMLTLRPGWRWSEHVKPIAGTDLCEARRRAGGRRGLVWGNAGRCGP